MNFKKIEALAIAVLMSASLVACSSGENSDSNSNNSEQKQAQEKAEFKFGQTIEMTDYDGGKYEVTFEGVRLTDERNEFSEVNPNKVLFLDYNYKNIDCEEDVFVTEGIEYKIADGEGNILSTYPVSDDSRIGGAVPAGIKSIATEAFAITSESNDITILVYDKVSKKVIGEIKTTLEESISIKSSEESRTSSSNKTKMSKNNVKNVSNEKITESSISKITSKSTSSNNKVSNSSSSNKVSSSNNSNSSSSNKVSSSNNSSNSSSSNKVSSSNNSNTTSKEGYVYANGGSSKSNKYHKSASVHNMEGAIKMTKSEAESKGYVACKKCY